MKPPADCRGRDSDPPSVRRQLFGRCKAAVRWLVPAAALALMPKCPVCLAGYIALGTGIGLSFTVASWLRMGLIVLSVAMLGWMAFRAVRVGSAR